MGKFVRCVLLEEMAEAVGTTPNYDQYIKWTSEALDVLGYPETSYNEVVGTRESITSFVMGMGPKVLLVSQSGKAGGINEVHITCLARGDSPVLNYSEVKAYLLRSGNKPLESDNLPAQIQYGTISKTGLSLNRVRMLLRIRV